MTAWLGLGKSRWRTWMRARTPRFLYDRGFVMPKAVNCGEHEWYTASPDAEHCYHCKATRVPH